MIYFNIFILTLLVGMPGYGTIIVIALALLLLFGGKKIPELMKGLGKGIKEFKDATNKDDDSTDKAK